MPHNTGHRTLTIRRKGGKSAKVAVPALTAVALNKYLGTSGADHIALDTGTSLHALQDSMGHADPRTTRRYDRARNNLTKSASYDVARALAQTGRPRP